MIINKETKIFGSFSKNPGNNGARFFNMAFQENDVNAIYLPVKCDSTEDVFSIIQLMNFAGAALASPHKCNAVDFIDILDEDARKIGAVNTVLVRNGKKYGCNTDWVGVYSILEPLHLDHLHIYGDGGFSRAVQYACAKLKVGVTVLKSREMIPESCWVFNATPAELQHPTMIDGRPNTVFGQQIFERQAKEQLILFRSLFHYE